MKRSVLHLLAQRPSATGSGVTLDALVAGAAQNEWEQHVVCGIPGDAETPEFEGLQADRVHPLRFDRTPLDFPVAGMSDVMPYASTRFSSMTDDQWGAYRDAWSTHLKQVIETARPTVIHAHHVWLMSSLVKEIAPEIPLVIHGHATGLRQMQLCPNRADEVRTGCKRADHFCVLHGEHRVAMIRALELEKTRVSIVGAGYREELFHARGRPTNSTRRVFYVGKLSNAKGVPQLLQAFDLVREALPSSELHIAGSGAGDEGKWIEREIAARGDAITWHGQLSQADLAEEMRRADVCVLPSFYEGLPLVLVEAAASGAQLVATALSGVVEELAPHLGDRLRLVPMPELETVDRPRAEALPRFVDDLTDSLLAALRDRARLPEAGEFEHFTWRAVFERVQKIWTRLVEGA